MYKLIRWRQPYLGPEQPNMDLKFEQPCLIVRAAHPEESTARPFHKIPSILRYTSISASKKSGESPGPSQHRTRSAPWPPFLLRRCCLITIPLSLPKLPPSPTSCVVRCGGEMAFETDQRTDPSTFHLTNNFHKHPFRSRRSVLRIECSVRPLFYRKVY